MTHLIFLASFDNSETLLDMHFIKEVIYIYHIHYLLPVKI